MKDLKLFITAAEIDKLNSELADKISSHYKSVLEKDEFLIVIFTLKGAVLFGADLIKKITVPIKLDFVRLTSYGSGIKTSGEVRILKDIETAPTGQHILVLDEIIDSGRTFHFFAERLKSQKPKSLKLCALLSKPSRREIDVKVDFLGREVEDKFLVGYGLDFNEKYRQLPDIYYI